MRRGDYQPILSASDGWKARARAAFRSCWGGGRPRRGLATVGSTQLSGYEDVKALPMSTSFRVDSIDTSKPLPAAGTVRITSWSSGPQG